MHKHAKMIDCLSKRHNGQRPLASALTGLAGKRVTFKMISNWKQSGVPWRFRGAFAKLASDNGVTVRDGFLIGDES